MTSALAIISKAVFEKVARGAQLGATLPLDHYASTHKSLEVLAEGGALFLVTVRPPDEELWLVAVLESPELGAAGWSAAANRVAITEVSRLRGQLAFSTGAGIKAKPGALGMSLQTPRVLTADDVALFRAATKSGGKPAASLKRGGGPSRSMPARATSATSAASSAAKSVATTTGAALPAALLGRATKSAQAAKRATRGAVPKSVAPAKPAKGATPTKHSTPAKPSQGTPPAKTRPAKTKPAKTRPAEDAAHEQGGAADPAEGQAAGGFAGADLAALKAAFAVKDGGAALATALAWWRTQRAPALADLIDAISDQVSGEAVTTEVDFTRLAIAKDPLDLGRLLPAVAELPVSFLPTAAELLAAYPDDPRLAKAVAGWAFEPITTSSSKASFWTKLLEASARVADTRVIASYKKRLAKQQPVSGWWDRFYRALERLVGKLSALPSVAKLDDKPLEQLARRVATLSAIGPRIPVRATETAPVLDGPLLAQAETHLRAGRVAPAIAALLERWREVRVPALADLIDRATRLLPTYDRPLARSITELQPAWIAAFDADPQAAMPQLLQNVKGGSTKLCELRFAQLATLPDDPRIALRLAEVAVGGTSPEAGQYWTRLFELLAKTRDVRTCGPLRAGFSDFTSTYWYHHKKGKRIVAKFAITPEHSFERWPLALDAADRALAARFEQTLANAETARFTRERELIAAIAEDPSDEHPRQVYADWLQERDHPRGELIALDGKSPRTAAETARRAELVAVPYIHGALDDFSESLVLDRGLVRTLEMGFYVGPLTWRSVASYPLLALVETLDVERHLHDPSPEDIALVVRNAPSLRTILHGRAHWAGLAPLLAGRFELAGEDLVACRGRAS